MKKFRVIFISCLLALSLMLVSVGAVSATDEGRTPGFWKNKLEAWAFTDYAPEDFFDEVFGVGPHETLMDVLNWGGGKWDALNRQWVAALLNASSPMVAWGVPTIIKFVQDSYSDGNWKWWKNYIEPYNQLGSSDFWK